MTKQIYERNKIGDNLTRDQIEELQQFGALEWGARDIAIYFNFDIDQFSAEYNDPESIITLAITRGRLQALATVNKTLLTNAQAGDLLSINFLEKLRREKSFKTSKLDIFGSFDNEKAFRRVYEYMTAGRTGDLSNDEKTFLDLLAIINSVDRQVGKRATIKFLTQQFGYGYDRAVDYYNQADALFYSNRNTTKEALRNKYAELLEDLAHAAKNVATTPKDYEAVGELIAKAAKIRKLDEPEIQRLPPQMYMRPLRVFSLTTDVIGLPSVNRQEINDQIQQLDVPEATKGRLRRESLVEDVDIIEFLNYGKQSEN